MQQYFKLKSGKIILNTRYQKADVGREKSGIFTFWLFELGPGGRLVGVAGWTFDPLMTPRVLLFLNISGSIRIFLTASSGLACLVSSDS